MTDCNQYMEYMMLSLDGALEPEQEEELRRHLEECPRCRALYHSYMEINEGILEMEEEAPEGLTAAVMGSIRREKEKASPVYFLKRAKFTVIAAAACLVLVVAGRGIGMGGSTAPAAGETAQQARSEPAAEAATADITEAAPVYVYEEETEEAAAEAEAQATEVPALMPAYEEGPAEAAAEEAAEDENTVGGVSAMGVLKALEADHRSGDLVVLSGSTTDDIFALFDTVWILDIPDGYRVYKVLREDFESVMDRLSWSDVVSTNPPGEDVYLYVEP